MGSRPFHCPSPPAVPGNWQLATGNWQLATGNCSSGRSGLRPSLVRGDSPRNAPLTPLHPPGVGPNVALRNRRPVAPPPYLRDSIVSPTRRVPMPSCVRPPPIAHSTVRHRPPQFPAPCPCPLPPNPCSSGPPLCGGTPPATPPRCTPRAGCGVNAALCYLRPNAPPQISECRGHRRGRPCAYPVPPKLVDDSSRRRHEFRAR